MSKTGVAKRIREALKHGPMTTAELRVCLDLSRGEANTAINDMMRAKNPLVAHDGAEPGARRYSLVREPAKPMPAEEAAARRRELARGHAAATRRRKGMRTWDEYVADTRKAAKPRVRRVTDEQRAARAERRAAAAKAREERQQAKRAALLAKLEAAPVTQVAEPVRLMSSAEWNGPIQRLEPWEVSKPLRITREVVRRMAA